jgi:hypothetical protein
MVTAFTVLFLMYVCCFIDTKGKPKHKPKWPKKGF